MLILYVTTGTLRRTFRGPPQFASCLMHVDALTWVPDPLVLTAS